MLQNYKHGDGIGGFTLNKSLKNQILYFSGLNSICLVIFLKGFSWGWGDGVGGRGTLRFP